MQRPCDKGNTAHSTNLNKVELQRNLIVSVHMVGGTAGQEVGVKKT